MRATLHILSLSHPTAITSAAGLCSPSLQGRQCCWWIKSPPAAQRWWDVDHAPMRVPALSHPALGQAAPKAAAACITQALGFGCFYVRFPQIFQFSGPKQLEVALGANSHKFCCLPTLPSHPKPQVLLAAVSTTMGVCPIALHVPC